MNESFHMCVIVSLTQLIWTMYNIYTVWGLNPGKKIVSSVFTVLARGLPT